MPAALHSLGCSAEEIAAALQRRRDADAKQAELQEVKDRAETAELEQRERVARAEADAPSTEAVKEAGKQAPSKPASENGSE